MSHLRTNLFPLDHLAVELAAFPLSSVDALRHGMSELDPCLNASSGELWRNAETSLLKSCAGVSVEELTAMRDRLWFGLSDRVGSVAIPLHEFATGLARAYLEPQGGIAIPVLRSDQRAPRWVGLTFSEMSKAREVWRWMSFALPEDFLLAALATENSTPTRVTTLSPQWERTLLDAGFAEPHLHLGAALDFPALWATTMRRLCDASLRPETFASPGAELRDGRDLATWLLLAGIGRLMLASFLSLMGSRTTPHVGFAEYLSMLGLTDGSTSSGSDRDFEKTNDSSTAGIRQCRLPTIELTQRLLLRHVLLWIGHSEVASARAEFRRVQSLYARLATPIKYFSRGRRGEWDIRPEALAQQVQRQDPLASWFEPQFQTGLTPELQWMISAFQYLRIRPNDHDFAKLLWQVIRVRNIYFRHVVLRPMTPGLQWFVRAYDRMRPGKHARMTTSASVISACQVSGLNAGLRSLEVRTAPDEGLQQVVGFLEEARSAFTKVANPRGDEVSSEALRRRGHFLAEHLEQEFSQRRSQFTESLSECVSTDYTRNGASQSASTPPEFGVVFHFVRQRRGGAESGRPQAYGRTSEADPRGTNNHSQRRFRGGKYRYAGFYSRRLRVVNAVSRALLSFPLTLTVLRGIDACTDELGIPTWVLVPMFRYLRDVSELASVELERQLSCRAPLLRATVHVGEDFVHLLGGLRRIDEALRFLKLQEGDRLGHAIALGVDAREWARSASRLPVTREERWLDLIWEWCQYAREQLPSPLGRQLLIEHELEQLTSDLFGEPMTPATLEMFVELLHDENVLRQVGFPFGARKLSGMMNRRIVPQTGTSESLSSSIWQTVLGHLETFLTSPVLFDRGREVLSIEPDGEIEALETVQRGLRQRVASHGVCVEINPSSNLLIANLGGIERRHPLWRLNSPFQSPELPEAAIPVCIGSDDPLTFATHLRAEYMLVHDALLAAGLPYEAAFQWLDQVRRAGMTYRFTLPVHSAWAGRPLTSLRGSINESQLQRPPGR